MTDMKKIAKYFFIAAASFAAMSCVEELNVVEKPVELTGKAYVFTASFDAETKTVLDEDTMTPMWLGDRDGYEYITVMEPGSVNTYVAENVFEPTEEVTFVMAEDGGTGLKGKAAFAVSPAGNWTCFANADSTGVTVTYNKSQVAYADTYDPAAPVAVAYNEDIEANPNFTFKNTSALLKFQIASDSEPVSSVKFYSLGGEALAGEMTLMVKGEEAMIVPAKGASSWVEIVGQYGENLAPETDYYIAVAPALLEKGIGFQFNDREDVQTFTISKEIKIERNKIYDLGVFSYTASKDNKWYLVGNSKDGVANNFSNVLFQAEGNNLVARNITFGDGQSFKILNPGKGVAYYAAVEKEVETETWVDLSNEKFYGAPKKGTYDVYVDYVDGVITGVALVAPGTDAPEYLNPEGMQFIWSEKNAEAGSWIVDLGVARYGVLTFGLSYSDYYKEFGWGDEDPSLVGNYTVYTAPYLNMTVQPVNATSGVICCKQTYSSPWAGMVTNYYRVEYSNYTGSSIDFYSPSQFMVDDPEGGLMEVVYPVLDENGDPVMVNSMWGKIEATYSGMATGFCADNPEKYGTIPVAYDVVDETIDILYATPDATQFLWIDAYEEDGVWCEETHIFDLGKTASGVLNIASNYDMLCTDPETGELYESGVDPRLLGKWLIESSYSDYEIVPTSNSEGEIRFKMFNAEKGVTEYYMIEYSNYMYNYGLYISSPAEIPDKTQDPIITEVEMTEVDPETGETYSWFAEVTTYPRRLVLDEFGNVLRDEKGNDCYWNGIGICMDDGSGNLNPVSMECAHYYYEDVELAAKPATPDGAQWTFAWDAMGGITACIDLGITTPGMLTSAYSMDEFSELSGQEIPEEMQGLFFQYMAWEYEIIPDEQNPECGQINIIGYNMYGEKLVAEGYYTDYNGVMFLFTCEMLYLKEAPMFIVKDTLPIYVESGAGVL